MVLDGFVPFLIDRIFPERCIICGAAVRDRPAVPSLVLPPRWPEEALGFFGSDFTVRLFPGIRVTARILCTACWLSLEPASPLACSIKRDGGGGEEECASRLRADDGEPIQVISPFLTNGSLLDVVKFLKFSGGLRAAVPLSWWLAFAVRRYLSLRCAPDRSRMIVTAVPLHPARSRRRGYNQAALLAAHTAKRLGLAFCDRLVERTRNTPYQSHLPEEMRAVNVRDAFRLRPGTCIERRGIVLVDDVVTTGETVASCVRALRRGLPASVAVLAVGRARGFDSAALRGSSADRPAL